MALSAAKQFLDWLSHDQARESDFVQSLEKVPETQETEALEAYGQAKGFVFTAQEFDLALDEAGYGVSQGRSISEMSFPELEKTEGGFYFHNRLLKRSGGGRKPRRKPYKPKNQSSWGDPWRNFNGSATTP